MTRVRTKSLGGWRDSGATHGRSRPKFGRRLRHTPSHVVREFGGAAKIRPPCGLAAPKRKGTPQRANGWGWPPQVRGGVAPRPVRGFHHGKIDALRSSGGICRPHPQTGMYGARMVVPPPQANSTPISGGTNLGMLTGPAPRLWMWFGVASSHQICRCLIRKARAPARDPSVILGTHAAMSPSTPPSKYGGTPPR